MSPKDIAFRPVGPGDMEFLYAVYASTRMDELAPLDWPEAELEGFLRMQFQAQHTYYQQHFAGAAFDVILKDGEGIGRLYLDRRQDEIRIIDIAILPGYRNAGIGTALLKDIQAEAAQSSRCVRIHVEKNNPALRLYQRLGFTPAGDAGVYWLMEWMPPAGASK